MGNAMTDVHPTRAALRTSTPRRAWLVWTVGVLAYVVAVFDRTSLGVAGVAAAERFDAGASVLSTFAVVQLLVYAGMQVPVGVLLDRFGSRAMIVAGALLMAAGQALLGQTISLSGAFTARVLVGLGDAMTFICVLRLVPAWFPARRVPTMTQLTGLVGQAGQIASAIPLAALLAGPGWTTAYTAAALAGLVVAVAVLVFVRDSPPGAPSVRASRGAREVGQELAGAWLEPGTRLGLWTHFTVQFSGTAFALLWGYPFLVSGVGLTGRQAGALLTVLVVGGMVSGLVLGRLTRRHPLRRSNLILGIVGMTIGAWTVVLLWPDRPPVWLVVCLVLVLATNGPASMVGFDFARTFNPASRLGSATGIVNVGGFVATLLCIFGIGVVLDLQAPSGRYGMDELRLAMCVQYLLWSFGLVGIMRTRTLARRRLAAQGTTVLPLAQAVRVRREQRRRSRTSG